MAQQAANDVYMTCIWGCGAFIKSDGQMVNDCNGFCRYSKWKQHKYKTIEGMDQFIFYLLCLSTCTGESYCIKCKRFTFEKTPKRIRNQIAVERRRIDVVAVNLAEIAVAINVRNHIHCPTQQPSRLGITQIHSPKLHCQKRA